VSNQAILWSSFLTQVSFKRRGVRGPACSMVTRRPVLPTTLASVAAERCDSRHRDVSIAAALYSVQAVLCCGLTAWLEQGRWHVLQRLTGSEWVTVAGAPSWPAGHNAPLHCIACACLLPHLVTFPPACLSEPPKTFNPPNPVLSAPSLLCP